MFIENTYAAIDYEISDISLESVCEQYSIWEKKLGRSTSHDRIPNELKEAGLKKILNGDDCLVGYRLLCGKNKLKEERHLA